jgi:PAS domain S-box-containing protein
MRERILTLSKDLISIAGTDGYLKYVNPAWKEIMGYSAKELLGRPFLDFVHPKERYRTKQELKSLNKGHSTYDFELRVVSKDGRIRHISWVVTPLKDDNLLYCIGRDITARKSSEEEAIKQRDIIARIGRTNRMGQLTGSIAHELNQPLTGILSNAQAGEIMIQNDNYYNDEMAEILADIAADAKRAGEMIRNLRELYREQHGQFKSFDLNTIIPETIRLIQSEFIKENVVVKTKLGSSPAMLHGNKIQIQQVLINLLTNGIQAMRSKAPEDRILTIMTEPDKDVINLWVEDCGPGIDSDIIDSIFEPLVTWKSGGTGMGLAISNSIIEAHGGKMWAENISTDGARVGFLLPILKEQEKV